MQQWRPENPPAMTFDEVSMERSKSFVKALQELKNLRPQLYSAAEYCEKSYLHSEQKQIKLGLCRTFWVLDNLKDYAVRALVNAVDHLGTVAYKLTDLFEQQTLDISTVELKISCLNQQILTCQTYADKEGLRQQQISATATRHHKHYILPNSMSTRIQGSLQQQADAMQNDIEAKPRPYPSGTSKTLYSLLASETNSESNGAPNATLGNGDSKASKMTSEVFHLMDAEESAASFPLSTHLQSVSGTPTSNSVRHPFGVRDHMEASRQLSAFRSFDNPRRREIRPPARSKSVLDVFFSKHKSIKQKKAYVS